MIGIGSMVKWGAIAMIVVAIGTGIKKGYEYHLDQIDAAVVTVRLELAVEKQKAVEEREVVLKAINKKDREEIEAVLAVERNRVVDLRRQLLIDHDLDRLLQRKPGLILNIVNEGTEEVLLELEELTQ